VFTVSCLYICTHICKCHETCIYIHRERERKKETERERKREKEREKERGREREWEWYVYLYIHIYICIYGVLNIRCATAGWISREVSRIEPLIKTMRKAYSPRQFLRSYVIKLRFHHTRKNAKNHDQSTKWFDSSCHTKRTLFRGKFSCNYTRIKFCSPWQFGVSLVANISNNLFGLMNF